jgi:RNA polymerase sigma factor (sigma-70 family)
MAMAGSETAAIGRDLRRLFDGENLAVLDDGELLDRFTRRDDGASVAFEAIVDRHGPAVLLACRRVSDDLESAEDAFQATFIVLARKAGSVRVGDSLRPWLLGVARRTALKARAGERRRRARECKAATPESSGSGLPQPDELAPIVRAEVDLLPEKYRDPVRLFYLEGKTQEETARALGWPVGSVSGRLFQARQLLRSRLSRRGFAPLGWLAAGCLAGAEAEAAVPSALRLKTLASATAAAPTSGAAVVLAGRVLRGMAVARLAVRAVGLVAVIAALGLGIGPLSGREKPSAPPAVPAPPEPIKDEVIEVDCYGDDLPQGAVARLGTTRFRQGYFEDGHAMTRVIYAHDGRSLVTVGSQGGVSVWEASSGRRIRRLEGNHAALSPDGRTLATAKPGLIRLWDFDTGRELRRAELDPAEDYRELAFSPDGSGLVAFGVASGHGPGGRASAALVGFETADLTERFRKPGDYHYARALAFAPDGKTLAVAVPDRPFNLFAVHMSEPDRSWIRFLDAADGSELRRITIERFDVASLAFSPDGRTLAAGIGDRTIRLYDPSTAEEKLPRLGGEQAMPAPEPGQQARKWYEDAARAASALAFSPDGSRLVSGQESIGYLNGRVDESALTIWDVPARLEVHRSFGHYGGVNGVAFALDGRTFATVGGEAVAKVWDASTGLEATPRPSHRAVPHLLAVSPFDGTVFTGGGYDHAILSWDPATGRCLGKAAELPAGVLSLDASPDGSSLLVDTWDGLTLRDLATRKEARRFSEKRPAHSGFYRASFSPDGRTATMELKVWEVGTGRLLSSFADETPGWRANSHYMRAIYSPDGRRLVAVEPPGVRVLDIASGTVVSTPIRRDIPDPTRADLSPDGRLVALCNFAQMQVGAPDGRETDLPIRVYELTSGREVLTLKGFTDQAKALAFSPDGRTIAAASGDVWHHNDRTVRVWDAITGRELRRFDVPENGASQLAYLPNGRSIVTLGMDGAALVWDVSGLGRRAPAGPLDGPTLEALWGDLASDDASRAYRASWALGVAEALPLFRERLRPVEPFDPVKLASLIEGLDADTLATRARSAEGLAALGKAAVPDLRLALARKPSAEARLAIELLLASTEGPIASPQILRTIRAIAALERIGTSNALEILGRLASGEPDSPVTAEALSAFDRRTRRGR